MNETEMLWRIDQMLRRILIFDSFKGHLVDTVENRLTKKNTNIAVIPDGCLQPLVAIN